MFGVLSLHPTCTVKQQKMENVWNTQNARLCILPLNGVDIIHVHFYDLNF